MSERRLHVLNDLRAVEIYVAVVESSSITRAAYRLGLQPSTVSKKVAELEERASTRLLHRTTRSLSMTKVGERFYDQCLRLLNEAERAEWELRDDVHDPKGRIRVTAPVVFAQRQISPLLPEFLARHPGIELELVESARTLNLVEEGFDLSIKIAREDQIGRTGQRLARNRRVVCASPRYLETFGEPQTPRELGAHKCLTIITRQRADLWRFRQDDGVESVRVSGPLVSDNASTLAEAAIQGAGIVMLGTYVVGDALQRGALREILPGQLIQDSAIIAVRPERNFLPLRITLFLKYLAERFGDPPVWERALPQMRSDGSPSPFK